MRKLSATFLNALTNGFLVGLKDKVIDDHDLNLEIRDNYINIYFKGNSLLKLKEITPELYKLEIHEKFVRNLEIPPIFIDRKTTSDFVDCIPTIKQNITTYGKRSLELEYEQVLIRANNYEPRNNSEYFVIDRQYVMSEGRFDLTGMFWDRSRRRQGQEVPVCLIEVKFALNQDISDVHNQLARYYAAIQPNAANIAVECETIFRQKLELGLYWQSPERIAAMQTLAFSREIKKFQFILVLVDYNPYSSKLDLENLKKLTFADQIKIFFGGFAMWQQNVKPLDIIPSQK